MQYYFAGMRDVALQQLASTGELRAYYKEALSKVTKDDSLPSLAYQQFSADAAIQLSHYEAAVESYRKLARLYPGNENYANRLVMLLRSFGQVAESNLKEAITIRQRLTNIYPTSEIYLTELGELYAELGDFENARKQWDAITGQAKGSPENYLSAASVFWDYYQYDDALRVINTLRKVEQNPNLYAFQAGAIYENKRDLQSAISEYTKDLVDYEAKQQSVYRLKRLADKPVLRQFIEKTVEERLASSKNNYSLVIGYARLLDRIGDIDAASEVFNRYIAKSGDIDFIHTARSFFAKKHRLADEIRALERLTEVATEGLPMMAYKLQLASVYEQKGDVAKAVLIYDNLVQSFPTSYGLIKTATKFYWRIGEKERTFSLLRNASLRGKGSFYFEFGLELADYQVLADNLQEAEATLVVLYEKNPFSNELFEKLTRVVAKQKKRDRLLELYKIAYKYAEEINDKDRYGYSAAFAALYTTMANSFEEVGDHVSALEQYCLKVNNGSDDGGNNLESAYDYARRYKLLDRLIGYYKEVSEQSSRNYRWNVALARIYELQDRWADAAREYEKAIRNEPQILTLYEAISDVYLQMRQSKEAIGWLTRAYQLSGSADRYKKLIAAVEIFKFDRAIARTYLRSMNTDDSKSQTYSSYKHLFAENFGTNIYKQGIYSFYITAYAEELVREGKTLTQIFGELWMLREKVKVEVEKPNNPGHQQAELVYQSFNSAIPEAVVSVIANKVTIEDRLAFGTKLKELVTGRDQTKDTLLLQIASLVSMPEVTEAVLKNQLAQSNPLLPESNYHTRLNALADFYADRGLFKQAITLLRSEYVKDPTHSKFGYWPKIALLASYANDTEVELEALRRYYQEMTGQLSSTNNEYVDRYLRLLTGQGESGRRELETLLSQNHPQKIQLINYLIRTSDKEFAYRAISSTNLSDLWKLTRRAQVAQALNDYSPETEQLFHKALGSQKIGDIIKNRPNPEEELTGDNWFSFAYTFGHWFETRPNLKDEKLARQYLLARVENRPKDIGAQRDLGNFYLTEKKYQRAINHLQLALTLASFNYQALEAGNSGVQASSEAQDLMLEVGEAYWRMGVEQKARRYWQAATDGDVSISTLQKYFTLLDYLGQANEARERITALIIERLKESKQNEDGTSSFSEYQNLIRLMANSAKDSAERFSYLDRLSMQTGSKDLLMMVASENLVEEAEKVVFIRRLIGLIKVKEIANDAEYLNYLAAAGYSKTKLNQVDDMLEDQYLIVEKGVVGDPYDREAATSQADWIKWRQKLIELLLKYGKTEEFREAFNEVALIDNAFRGHATRPEWLRLAKARALLKLGEKARAIELLEGFVGLRTRPDQTFLPNTNRAVTASRILSNEQNIEESFRLLSRTYSKLLSAGNFDLTSFIGYADAEFKVGNVDTALKTLSLVLELAEPNIKRERKEEIAASFGTTTFVDNGFSVYLESALMAVSEAAARYGRVDLALKYEQRLFEREQLPEHRVVLARLIALAGKSERAVDLLVDTLAIRKINSSERIRALAMLAKIGEREKSLLVRAAENSKVLSKEDQQVIRFL
ncbi:MAG: tetratricopeptide repeat protein, partial [Blastocatellia bacterium]|nr:tetratricopeptide repeat protein [Blastocatellia bacterium]